jgi:hypothetical protein
MSPPETNNLMSSRQTPLMFKLSIMSRDRFYKVIPRIRRTTNNYTMFINKLIKKYNDFAPEILVPLRIAHYNNYLYAN